MAAFTVTGLTSVINQLLPEPHAGLLAGILFGTKATFSPELYQELVQTGTLHIVALSGMNITLVAGFFSGILLWVFSRRVASLLTILGVGLFVLFVGPSPSVTRAAIMGSLSLLAVVFGRQNWAILSWMLAVGIMLLLNFSWLFDVSFQLSALATLGIILFGRQNQAAEVGVHFSSTPPSPSPANHPTPSSTGVALSKNARLPAAKALIWRLAANNLNLTLAAQVFTIPLILIHFHRISLISPVSNLLIGWTLAPVTILGWLTAVLGWIFLPLGQLVAWIDWVFLQYLLTAVSLTSKIPFASLGR